MPRSSTIDGIATETIVESMMMRATPRLIASSPHQRNRTKRSALTAGAVLRLTVLLLARMRGPLMQSGGNSTWIC